MSVWGRLVHRLSRSKRQLVLYLWCVRHIPMVMWLAPQIITLSSQRCVIKIRLGWRSRNHLRSMYFGALCVGADLAGALMAMRLSEGLCAEDDHSTPVSVVFRDVKGSFVRRSEQHTLFICEDGDKILACAREAHLTSQRQDVEVEVKAYEQISKQLVAHFKLVLSLKAIIR